MLCRPHFLVSTTTNPFVNLATEKCLIESVSADEVVLFLWQNHNTIVIGRNQNPWKECRVAEFEADGGQLARRLSGGGAVFHDTGNVNFTFAAHAHHYNVARQMRVICEAVRSFGIDAHVSGRNDAVVREAKFSGNAFFQSGARRCHHGTIMIEVDTEKLARYLQPDPKKLAAKGIDSVRSRVVNLATLNEGISVKTLSSALIEAMGSVYGAPATPLSSPCLDSIEVERHRVHFEDWDWRFGKALPFTHAFGERYGWGNVDVELTVSQGNIDRACVYSDALDADFIAHLADALEGCRYETRAIDARLNQLQATTEEQRAMIADCVNLFVRELR